MKRLSTIYAQKSLSAANVISDENLDDELLSEGAVSSPVPIISELSYNMSDCLLRRKVCPRKLDTSLLKVDPWFKHQSTKVTDVTKAIFGSTSSHGVWNPTRVNKGTKHVSLKTEIRSLLRKIAYQNNR